MNHSMHPWHAHSPQSGTSECMTSWGGQSPVSRRICERGFSWSGRVRAQPEQRASDPSGHQRLALVRLACPPSSPLESTTWSISGALDRELKNASWMPNFGFTIGVHVNIKQFSSLKNHWHDIHLHWSPTKLGYHSTPECSISMDSTLLLLADMGSNLS
jgi:hypothetical protein